MANEVKVTKIESNVFLEMETFVLLRRKYSNDGEKVSKSEIVRRACEDCVKDMRPTASELAECQSYYEAQYKKRMDKRDRKRFASG